VLRALVESAGRFPGLPPHGYEWGDIRWVFEIDARTSDAQLVLFGKGDLIRMLPTRGDRSGQVSEQNLKPALLADRARYALGMRANRELDGGCLEYGGFRSLIERLDSDWPDSEPSCILRFLRRLFAESEGAMRELRSRIVLDVKPNDMVAFRVSPTFPFELPVAQSLWRKNLETEYRLGDAECCCCGTYGPVLRILPSQVSFAGYSCPISSFNASAFNSFGREQTANSPLCFGCASSGTRVLQFLLDSERHRRVLARDGSRGAGKSPLRNQWAVFWLKEQPPEIVDDAPLDVEALFSTPLGTESADGSRKPPADPAQFGRLYGMPFSASARALRLDQNRFYAAVLSPNKSRLVMREWIDEPAGHVVETLAAYDAARTIRTADGAGEWRPEIPSMLAALKPWKSKSAFTDANLVRSLLRTAYKGVPPPIKLLEAAVLQFRIPDRAKDRREEGELRERRQTLAAAIKFVITYGKKEAILLQTLDKTSRSGAYLCGRLLAILEEAQGRSSRWRVQATLVDRYYGGAATSPAATLTVLINQSTKSHMPKIRKIGAGYQELEQSLEEVMASIDDNGGFPASLTLYQQGEFALGFYHQRADYRAARPFGRQTPPVGPALPKEQTT
jgi:CRISPR-associated protein Csd1